MREFLGAIKELVTNFKDPRLRDRRGHYATSHGKCMRDQYWEWNKEPETNPQDFVGKMKMSMGKWIEEGLKKYVLNRMHFYGYHLISTEIPVGGSDPAWDGYIDAMMAKRTSGGWKKFIIEIKTKYGAGASFFFRKKDVDKDYLMQIGLYLREAYKKDGIVDGCITYLLLGDACWSEMVNILCRYVPETDEVHAYAIVTFDGGQSCDVKLKVSDALKRWDKLNDLIQKKEQPACPEYQYKYPLTDAMLRSASESALTKALDQGVVMGDWKVKYSRYKDKQLKLDGISPGYSDAERAKILSEYKRRHPASKRRKPK